MKHILYFTFSILLILFGVVSSYQMRWISDDAFISLRYAKNFAEGKGLVFNEGEFVEGYTNFLWTVLMIPFHLTEKIDPVDATYFFGILSFLGICVYLFLFWRKFSKEEFSFPFALSCFVLLHHNRVFATGGLETSLHGFLFLAASYHLLQTKEITYYKLIPGVFLSCLSCLNRPDGALFHVLVGLYIAASFFQTIRLQSFRSAILNPSFGILVIIYSSPALFYIWKLEYYGNLLPNTFYAKSGGSVYLSQGLLYLTSFLKMYYALIPLGGFVLWSFYKTIQERFFQGKNGTQKPDWILLVLFPILYAGYYTWIGGDFMFSRFYLPILPLLFVWTEREILTFPKKYPQWKTIANVFLYGIPLLILLRWDIYKGTPLPVVHEIADENQIYKRESTEKVRNQILPWKKHFESSKVRVAFAGSECILIYYLNPILAIETEAGLTDPVIARTQNKERGRVGHGKMTPLQYLKDRNVHLLLYSDGLPPKKEYDEFLTGDFSAPWRILTYSPSVMKELLKISSFHAVNFESYLDSYKYEYKNLNTPTRKEKFSEFESYYFRTGEDRIRENWYRKNL
ncbi:hypothetical protein EHQ76_04335 [Leptospira barantonii]|uniref:Glycosyltransferase RgtA/B/C/D-like domain-containing protein n=1 Tax=Leptospira barantonii TaxID=2023184 RepID=A0A5F2BQP0_9LEPT|nr:hypothetical protein [Leptospira barantonii]TGM07856.1 hypothetical protein EHQ76_04335 [Leptospira barantonii]